MEEAEDDHTLVMPFVCVASNGGRFDDDSFVAGMRVQEIWSELEGGPTVLQQLVRTELVDQLDLVAMHFGYSLVAKQTETDPEWTFATFTQT